MKSKERLTGNFKDQGFDLCRLFVFFFVFFRILNEKRPFKDGSDSVSNKNVKKQNWIIDFYSILVGDWLACFAEPVNAFRP